MASPERALAVRLRVLTSPRCGQGEPKQSTVLLLS